MITFAPPISSLEQAQDIMRSSGRYSLTPELWRDVRVAIFPHLQRNADPLKDVSGGGFDLTLDATNPPSWVAGDLGPVLSFDGTNDESAIPSTASLANGTNYSIFSWVNINDQVGTDVLYGEGNTTLSNPILWLAVTAGSPYVAHRDDGGTIITEFSSPRIVTERWHSLATVRNGDDWQIFADGELTASKSQAGIGATTIDSVDVGAHHFGSPTAANFLTGDIGLVATWARSLGLQEIQHLHRDPFAMLRPRKIKTIFTSIEVITGGQPFRPRGMMVPHFAGGKFGRVA